MPGWKVVKTDLDRPNAADINQFLVTTKDISRTGYSSQWKANIDWQFRVRALNRRAPANATAKTSRSTAPRPLRIIWQTVGPPPSTPDPVQTVRYGAPKT